MRKPNLFHNLKQKVQAFAIGGYQGNCATIIMHKISADFKKSRQLVVADDWSYIDCAMTRLHI